MIKTSREYKDSIIENRVFHAKAAITLADGTVLSLDDGNIMEGGLSFDEWTSGNGTFDIGSAVIGRCKILIDNMDDAYREHDFTDAAIRPAIGLELADSIEWLNKGIYTVDEAKMSGATISITALDNMAKFDKACGALPAKGETLRELAMNACSACDVTLGTSDFPNADYKLASSIEDALTWRQSISYVAQIAGCYAKINANGHLILGWYDFSAFEDEGELDGGGLGGHDQGAEVDGGDFSDYGQETTVDGGGFEGLDACHHIYALASQEICTDDVVITGIKVTEDTDGAATCMYGGEGYVLSISDNPFIGKGQAEAVAACLGEKVVGMRFRPLTVSALSDPSIEAGDLAVVSDRRGNAYRAVITNLSYTIGNYETYACDAETPSRNSADRNAALTKAIVKKLVEAEATERERMFEDLNTRLENSGGLFTTFEKLPDGSVKYYLHDKQQLADSTYVWKITSEVMAASTDGGKTYTTALSVDGQFLIDQISTIGLTAEIVKTGILKSKDYAAGASGLKIDLDKGTIEGASILMNGGEINISAESSSISKISIRWQSGSRSITAGITPQSIRFDDGQKYTQVGVSGVYLSTNGYYWDGGAPGVNVTQSDITFYNGGGSTGYILDYAMMQKLRALIN